MTRLAGTYVNCSECRTPLDPTGPNTYRRVIAWEKKSISASRRSGADVVLREHLEEFCCADCVRRLKRGVAPLQAVLM